MAEQSVPAYGEHKPKITDVDCGHDVCDVRCPGPVDIEVCAYDDQDWPCEVVKAHAGGVAAGRAQAAVDLRFAAEGRAEYARAASPEHRELLAFEAGTLDHAAAVAGGDIQPLYGWVPSRMWTPEMNAKLAEEAP